MSGAGRGIQNVMSLQGCDSATSYSKYAVASPLSYSGFVYKPLGPACAYSSRFLTKRGLVFGKKKQEDKLSRAVQAVRDAKVLNSTSEAACSE